ncbi:ATP-grasp domain-containing protein [Streptacidiphilus sp. EB129]|uniref:ATP-grasp domain-containing protein n=1 Tax=Streptacidiphilus sp. EB129 TaxID=3156262 RepID=UPI00351292B0
MTADSAPERPLLLLVASGWQLFREYLLSSISTEYRVHMFHSTEPSWEQQYLDGWTVLPSTLDGPAMAEAALRLSGEQQVSGVLCWDESRILATSYVAQALGLPNGDPEVVWRLRDKAQTRAALDAAGVPQPRSFPVKTLDQALAAAERVGYPAVLKPRGLGASLGVVRVENAEELRERFAFTRDTPAPEPVVYASDHPVLVEECVVGDEVSVDSVVQDGKVTPLFVGRKVVGYPPYAEEVGHHVDAADPLLLDPDFQQALQDTHTALGFRDGWTHSEFMLTAAGPRLIEVNGRLGGDLIPFLGLLATGIDPGRAAAAAACGLTPNLQPTRQLVGGVRFFYVDEPDSVVESVGFDQARLPAGIVKAVAMATPGKSYSPPPEGTVWGRIALAVALSTEVADCTAALDAAEQALQVEARTS